MPRLPGPKRPRRVALGVFAMSLLACIQVYGHRPIEADHVPDRPERALEIDRPDVSQVYYAEVSPERPQVWFRFKGTEGQEIYFSLGVPVIDRLGAFRPRVALVGPGLDSGGSGDSRLPFDLPGAERGSERASGGATGVEIYLPRGEPRFFHEHFTDTESWILLEVTRRLPRTGEYYLVAYTPWNPKPGDKLWLSMGRKERFTLRDLFSFRRWRRNIRRFHELPGGEAR
jgi:hypothetical protein